MSTNDEHDATEVAFHDLDLLPECQRLLPMLEWGGHPDGGIIGYDGSGLAVLVGRPKAKTTGQPTSSASGSLYRPGYDSLATALVAVAPQDAAGRYQLSKVRFDLVVNHSYPENSKIYTIKLLGCSLDKRGAKHGEGVEADVVDVDLNPMKIVEIIDGKEVVLL